MAYEKKPDPALTDPSGLQTNPLSLITIVSQGTQSHPKPLPTPQLHAKVPNLRVVQAPGASGTI